MTSDSWIRCAEIVEQGDPVRFSAAMASPLAARKVLFPLYAFNIEVSRAPWLTKEPMIAEMRLQWWRDVLEEIAQEKPVRAHEVSTALAGVIDPKGAEALDALVAARRWDIYDEAFEDPAHFSMYMEQTAGVLMWACARALGAPSEAKDRVIRFGAAAGLARFFQAIPELESRGKRPLVDGRAEAVQALAREALNAIRRTELRGVVGGGARAALTEGWMAKPLLEQAARTPARVAQGALGISPLKQSIGLWWWR